MEIINDKAVINNNKILKSGQVNQKILNNSQEVIYTLQSNNYVQGSIMIEDSSSKI